jgi:hypothetical protein
MRSIIAAATMAGMWQLLSQNITAVPRELWWDNEAGIGRRGRLTEPVTALVGTLGSRLVQMKPYDPESKGMVERANRYWRPRSYPDAASPRRRTSMINSVDEHDVRGTAAPTGPTSPFQVQERSPQGLDGRAQAVSSAR